MLRRAAASPLRYAVAYTRSVLAKLPLHLSSDALRAEVRRLCRRGAGGALLLAFIAAVPAAAQDEGLDPILLANRDETQSATNVEAQGFQLYRLPLSFHVRSLDKHPWGLRVTFPLSLSSLSVNDEGAFVVKLGITAIIPGIEVEIPVGSRTLVRPFGEIGIGKGSDSSVQVFSATGVRVRTTADQKYLHVTAGGRIAARRTPTFNGTATRYASFEGGADAEVPLGFSVRGRQARAGVYMIGRAYDGLELERESQPPIVLQGQIETGLSFSTAPDLRIWKIPLRWLAAGYQFGRVSGIRVYMTFPF